MGVSIQNPTVSSQDPASMLQLLIPSSNTGFVQQATGGMMQQATGGMVQQQTGVIPSTLPANVSIAQIATQQPVSYVQGITQPTVSTTQALTPQLGYLPGTTQPSIVTTESYVQGIIPGNVQGTNTHFALPFTTNVTISISILQTFRSWVATSHLRPPMAFLSHNSSDTPGLAPLMNVLFWGRCDFPISFSGRDMSRNVWNRL